MQFLVLSKADVERFKAKYSHILISIRPPDAQKPCLPKDTGRLDTLYLKFHDVDKSTIRDDIVLFDRKMARKILTFVEIYKDSIDAVIVHCEAGISRSAGVAAALSYIYNHNDYKYFRQYIPNRLVYRLILNEYYGE